MVWYFVRNTLYLSQEYLISWGKPQETIKEGYNMVTKIIDEAKWTEREQNITAWCTANPELAKEENREVAIKTFFSLGKNQPEMRGIYWTSIASLFKGLTNSPIGGGRSSRMSIGQKSQMDLFHAELKDGLKEVFLDNAYLQATERTHGKSGGIFYALMDDDLEVGATAWANDKSRKFRVMIGKAYNDSLDNDATATIVWPTVLSADSERQVLDFNEEGMPNLTVRTAITAVSAEEEE